MTVGDRIKEQRELSRMSQVELAEKIHVSKQTLYKYENNIVTNIPSDKIQSIATVLEISPAYLMGWKESKSVDNLLENIGGFLAEISKDEKFIVNIEKLWQLSETDKEHIFLIVNDLYEKKRKERNDCYEESNVKFSFSTVTCCDTSKFQSKHGTCKQKD